MSGRAAGALAALALAGCSGGSDEPVRIAEAPAPPAAGGVPASDGWGPVCARYARLVAALPAPTTAERLPAHIADIAALVAAERADLARLEAPPRGRLLLASLERTRLALEHLAEAETLHDDRQAQVALRALARSNRAARRWARAAGVPACGAPVYGTAR